MSVPVTFSAPGEGYTPSTKDRLRDGIYLMLCADNVNWREYAWDADNPDAGERIFSEVEGRDDTNESLLLVPQQVVVVAFPSLAFQYKTNRAGVVSATVNIVFFEPPDTPRVVVDAEAPPITVLAKMQRVEEILQRGTLYDPTRTSESGRIVDPYATPLLEDGTYDPTQIVYIATAPPTRVAYLAPRAVPRKAFDRVKPDEWITNPARDIAVAYALMATYEIEIADRENQDGE